MYASIYCYAWDVKDEGVKSFLDTITQRGAAGGVSLATSYHMGRFLLPHNPKRKLYYVEDGMVYFHPERSRYEGIQIKPHIASVAQEWDPLGTVCEQAKERDMKVVSWTVCLHNTRLGMQHPQCTQVNAFGDHDFSNLCPANEEARAYVRALVSDIGANYPVDAIELESLCYHGFDHGYHHEFSFAATTARSKFLLGLCFCPACMARAEASGIDAQRLRSCVQTYLEEFFQDPPAVDPQPVVTRADFDDLVDGEMGRFLDMREEVVTSFMTEVVETCKSESSAEVTLLDIGIALKGFFTGKPTGDLGIKASWQFATNPEKMIAASDGITVTGYVNPLDRFEQEIEAYKEILPDDKSLAVTMRPTMPDTDSPGNLVEKIALCRQWGVQRVGFYNYGFFPLNRLDWIKDALAS
jgi:hypothetical protein